MRQRKSKLNKSYWMRYNDRPMSHTNKVTVECIETGEKFKSVSEAAAMLDVSTGYLSKCIIRDIAINGKTFKKVI